MDRNIINDLCVHILVIHGATQFPPESISDYCVNLLLLDLCVVLVSFQVSAGYGPSVQTVLHKLSSSTLTP